MQSVGELALGLEDKVEWDSVASFSILRYVTLGASVDSSEPLGQ